MNKNNNSNRFFSLLNLLVSNTEVSDDDKT